MPCVFSSKDLKFFSTYLTPEGYEVDPKKEQAITEMKPPQNLQDLYSYLGLVNYLKCFSPKIVELKVPLRTLNKRDTVYTWESSQQAAFEAIQEIANTSVLAYFDKSKQSIIQTDASKRGLGAVLLQDGKQIIYASMTETQHHYSNIDRELLSVVFAL